MRSALLVLVALLASAPFALAQEEGAPGSRPDDAAWTEDCPPDMMCAAGDPIAYGPDDCIECSGPVSEGTCMDGSAASCDPNVQYMDGPSRGPSDGSCENCRGDAPAPEVETAREVPLPGATLAVLALAGVALVVAARWR